MTRRPSACHTSGVPHQVGSTAAVPGRNKALCRRCAGVARGPAATAPLAPATIPGIGAAAPYGPYLPRLPRRRPQALPRGPGRAAGPRAQTGSPPGCRRRRGCGRRGNPGAGARAWAPSAASPGGPAARSAAPSSRAGTAAAQPHTWHPRRRVSPHAHHQPRSLVRARWLLTAEMCCVRMCVSPYPLKT